MNASRKQCCLKFVQVVFYVNVLYVEKNREIAHKDLRKNGTSERGRTQEGRTLKEEKTQRRQRVNICVNGRLGTQVFVIFM